MQDNSNSGLDLVGLLKQAGFAALIAAIVFIPIVGMVLNGLGLDAETGESFIRLNYYLERPLVLVGLVFLARILIGVVQSKLPAKKSDDGNVVVGGGLGEWLADSKYRWTFFIVTGLFLIALPFFTQSYLATLSLILIYVLLGLGLNIVVGLAGLLDLGFVGFYAVGAYGYALGYQYLGLSFWAALPLAALLAGLCGIILGFPVLRMHGDYLAIVTLGFGEIIRLVLENWSDFTGGPNGVDAPYPMLFGWEFTKRAKQGGVPFHEAWGISFSSDYRDYLFYFILLAACLVTVYFVQCLKNMSVGRAWEALREDEIACRSLGIHHVTVKLSAFATGAMIGGIAGVMFAATQGFISPTSFTFFESALVLAIVVLGGMGSTLGVVVAAVVLTLLPRLMLDFSDYRMLIFGVLMVVMMIWRPRGLLKIRRPRYSLGKAE